MLISPRLSCQTKTDAISEKRGAKVVLIGDPEQLQAIEAGAAFRSIAERHSSVEITQVPPPARGLAA